MAQNITVTLTDEQVQQALVYARKVYPDATNDELREQLEHAAYWGPGIRDQIAKWEYDYTRQTENENRQTATDEFLVSFPAEVPDPEPPE